MVSLYLYEFEGESSQVAQSADSHWIFPDMLLRPSIYVEMRINNICALCQCKDIEAGFRRLVGYGKIGEVDPWHLERFEFRTRRTTLRRRGMSQNAIVIESAPESHACVVRSIASKFPIAGGQLPPLEADVDYAEDVINVGRHFWAMNCIKEEDLDKQCHGYCADGDEELERGKLNEGTLIVT
ncbi:hypothetical protein C8R44DRAFT_753597 [Mycena epipterygia]|nr:hypothetical protein C8R44DRAFT_753597 [Mycena epipterygia]